MRPLGRLSGILLPVFSFRSRDDFGIGDFGAFEGLFDWMEAARQRMLMVLPLLPTAPGDPSPYATRSAFGLNPLFIHLPSVPEFETSGGFGAMSDEDKRRLDEARAAPRIRYELVFPVKGNAFRRAFDAFFQNDLRTNSARARAFSEWAESQRDWLETFALFAAISDDRQNRAWWEWPEPLRDRHPDALRAEAERLEREVLFRKWLQWLAETQWREVRTRAERKRILLCGDEPFIIGQDSADAWANPRILRRDARLGVPPDAFSATGQDWGLPWFDFDEMAKDDYAWLRFRARKAASYYDVRRVDHAVGYFRQWIRDPRSPTGRFVPEDESRHIPLGERHFQLLSQNAGIIAEDLGVIPDWVRQTLTRMGIPGYRVLRWEKDGPDFRNPHDFPAVSLATTGTHDTETEREWWESSIQQHEREAMARAYSELHGVPITPEFTPQIHEAILAAALNSGSDLVVLPWQDVLGTRERINLPGSMIDANWSYRIHHNADELLRAPETRAAAALMARLTEAAGR
ncbi:MAG: 4-alpha-glucanotransferase [Myxococcaceae bacterium]|nr:4-alpha-glucanotransferase [Myxococcaceae bacterium]